MGVQGMRYEGHGWDPKGPASIHHARAALDKNGPVIGYVFESKGFSRVDIDTNESNPVYSLAGRLIGLPLKPLQGFSVPPNPTDLRTNFWPGRRSLRCSTAPRHCAPRICAIPWARRSSSQRILYQRDRRRDLRAPAPRPDDPRTPQAVAGLINHHAIAC